ncbi:hypothetical protein KW787_00065 [Candidatus Pacearchaeota archaeon]|nr:hypothetical protein [Candidatus Pacearchaeota archaeon]
MAKSKAQMKSMKMDSSMKHNIPTGVKVISILDYIGGAFGIIFGLIFILGGGAIANWATSIPGASRGLVGAGLAVIGVVLIIFGVLGILLGRGVWKGRSWARIIQIILAVLGALGALGKLFTGHFGGIVSLALNVWIGWYLVYNKEGKRYFS